jgi:hypothetical protein
VIFHCNAAKGIIRYLEGTLCYGLEFIYNENSYWLGTLLQIGQDAYVEKSITGYLFRMGSRVISSVSKKKLTIALLSVKAY